MLVKRFFFEIRVKKGLFVKNTFNTIRLKMLGGWMIEGMEQGLPSQPTAPYV